MNVNNQHTRITIASLLNPTDADLLVSPVGVSSTSPQLNGINQNISLHQHRAQTQLLNQFQLVDQGRSSMYQLECRLRMASMLYQGGAMRQAASLYHQTLSEMMQMPDVDPIKLNNATSDLGTILVELGMGVEGRQLLELAQEGIEHTVGENDSQVSDIRELLNSLNLLEFANNINQHGSESIFTPS